MVDGLEIRKSRSGHADTIARLLKLAGQNDLSVIAHVDHSEAASRVELSLPPTDLFLIGNPRGGTLFMQASQTAAIDLPLHLLVWTDHKAQTYVAFDDPRWISKRHGIEAETKDRANALHEKLAEIAAYAAD